MPRITRNSQTHQRDTSDEKSKAAKKENDQQTQLTKEVSKTALKEKTALNDALKKNCEFQTELDNLKEAYAEKKHKNKELKKKNKELEQKLNELNQYILKMKKDRKIAESIHKDSISNLISTSAQNQALMAVLTTQQQTVQQVVPASVLPAVPLQLPISQQHITQGTLYPPPMAFRLNNKNNQNGNQHPSYSGNQEFNYNTAVYNDYYGLHYYSPYNMYPKM